MLIPNGSLIMVVAAVLMLVGFVLVIVLVVRSLSGPGTASSFTGAAAPADRLRQLDELRRQGLISDEELAVRRRSIIESI